MEEDLVSAQLSAGQLLTYSQCNDNVNEKVKKQKNK